MVEPRILWSLRASVVLPKAGKETSACILSAEGQPRRNQRRSQPTGPRSNRNLHLPFFPPLAIDIIHSTPPPLPSLALPRASPLPALLLLTFVRLPGVRSCVAPRTAAEVAKPARSQSSIPSDETLNLHPLTPPDTLTLSVFFTRVTVRSLVVHQCRTVISSSGNAGKE